MNYKYSGQRLVEDRRHRPACEAEARAKFAYFRQAEGKINGGPAPAPEAPKPVVKHVRHREPIALCNTYPGYRRHLRLREAPCRPCLSARNDYQREYRARVAVHGPVVTDPSKPKRGAKCKPLGPFDPTLCGTTKGYRQHHKHGNERCQGCKDAYNAYYTEYRGRRNAH